MDSRVGFKKNFLLAFNYLFFPIGIYLLIDCRQELTKEDRTHVVAAFVYAALFVILSCIPFVGWAAECVLFVFYVIAIVKMFLNKPWETPLIYKLAGKFVKD